MNSQTNNKLILHRPSRSLKRTALSVASSGTGSEKSATAQPSHLSSHAPTPTPLYSISPSNLYDNKNASGLCSRVNIVGNTILKPRCVLKLAAFNVRTLLQPGQQAALARTIDSLSIDICCVSETRIQDPSNITMLTAPDLSRKFFLRTSGDAEARAAGKYGVGIVLNNRAQAALLDWIPVSSRLCAVRLQGSIKVNKKNSRKRCLFVISAYAPTNCSSDSSKDEFYDQLFTSIQSAKSSDIVVLAGDLNAQVGKLSSTESFLGGSFALPAQRTDNGDRLLQLCATH